MQFHTFEGDWIKFTENTVVICIAICRYVPLYIYYFQIVTIKLRSEVSREIKYLRNVLVHFTQVCKNWFVMKYDMIDGNDSDISRMPIGNYAQTVGL